MAMADLIYSPVGCFTSIREPYIRDRFVAGLYTQDGAAETARARFGAFLRGRPLLPLLLREIARARGGARGPVPVVDCGVYMGVFTIAAALQAERAEVDVALSAYEANPDLIGPIRSNLALYGLQDRVRLDAAGIGGRHGTMPFVHAGDGLIGGTLFNTEHKLQSSGGLQGGAVMRDCPVIPLAAALPDDPAPGLVKIDIEGNEVAAFGSIARRPDALRNVFLVEYAPFQGRLRPRWILSYDRFLLRHFDIYDLGNWLWVPRLRRLGDRAALRSCLAEAGSGAPNTDLLLVPRGMTALSERLSAAAAGGGAADLSAAGVHDR